MTNPGRLRVLAGAFFICLATILIRVSWLSMPSEEKASQHSGYSNAPRQRPVIEDRNGRVLAISLKVASLFANPKKIRNIDDTIDRLNEVMPELSREKLRKKLQSNRGFVWIKRKLSPKKQAQVHALGLPGLYFEEEFERIYPAGKLAAHILGHVNIDNKGMAGIERYIDTLEKSLPNQPVRLSIDIGVQHILHSQLEAAMQEYRAKAAAGVMVDIFTGEVRAMSSLPGPNPNIPAQLLDKQRFDRITGGTFELGSVFKLLNTAMALQTGVVEPDTKLDAINPLYIGKYKIDDLHPQRRMLDVAETFIHSSNIASARIAEKIGMEQQLDFFARLRLTEPITSQAGRTHPPSLHTPWLKVNSLTASYGHGISVTPLQFVMAATATVNGGILFQPSFMESHQSGERVFSREVSEKVRKIMRRNVTEGTGRKADIRGYMIGGKTGSAEKVINGRYDSEKLLTSFIAAFPMNAPRFTLLVMLDEPASTASNSQHITAGWNAAPLAGRIIARTAPILGVSMR
jgi:cell division protein FtsI (penicillin-binding protein 3)